MTDELKPCPFCGGQAYIEQRGTPRQSCIVECGSCGLRHDSGDEGDRCGTSWNRRALLAAGASEGQAEPIYQARDKGQLKWLDQSKDAHDHMAKYPLIFDTRIVFRESTFTALRERIAELEKDAARYRLSEDDLSALAVELWKCSNDAGFDDFREQVRIAISAIAKQDSQSGEGS